MCILLKLHYAKFDVCRLFCSKVIEKNLWGVGSTHPSLGKGRVNEITLFRMALFWQKAIELFTKFIIHFLTYRVVTRNFIAYLFYRSLSDWAEYGLLATGRCSAKLIDGRGLLMGFNDFSSDVNSVNKSSRIKQGVRLNVIRTRCEVMK